MTSQHACHLLQIELLEPCEGSGGEDKIIEMKLTVMIIPARRNEIYRDEGIEGEEDESDGLE